MNKYIYIYISLLACQIWASTILRELFNHSSPTKTIPLWSGLGPTIGFYSIFKGIFGLWKIERKTKEKKKKKKKEKKNEKK